MENEFQQNERYYAAKKRVKSITGFYVHFTVYVFVNILLCIQIYLMSKTSYPHKTINGVKKRLHRHIMEEHLGRLLEPNEHVYHINGNPKDNSLENLIVITKKSYDVNVKQHM